MPNVPNCMIAIMPSWRRGQSGKNCSPLAYSDAHPYSYFGTILLSLEDLN